jgi:hypothetical protein
MIPDVTVKKYKVGIHHCGIERKEPTDVYAEGFGLKT